MKQHMPWFSEAHELLQDPSFLHRKNIRQIFVYLECMTRPRLGLNGDDLGIANRRRIWGACEQLAELYLARIPEDERPRGPNAQPGAESAAERIWKAAENPQTAPIRPLPNNHRKRSEIQSVQWIRSWDEIGAPQTFFETRWDRSRCLVGLALEICGDRRPYPRDCAEDDRVLRHELRSGSRIVGLILHISHKVGAIKGSAALP